MKTTFFFLAASLILLPLHSIAQEAAKEPDAETMAAAKELFQTMDMEEILNGSMDSAMDGQMSQLKQIGLPEEGLAELKTEMLKFIKEVMPWSELEPEMTRIYASNFTKAELDDLTAFYKTPTGQKAAKLTPVLMAEGMKIGQDRMMARMGELQQRITPIIQKHMQQQ